MARLLTIVVTFPHRLGDVINKWRKTELGIPTIAASMGPSLPTYLKIPHTYCWSPALVPKPKDWGVEIGRSNSL